MKKIHTKTFLIDTAYFILGSLLFGLGLYTFALQANFAPGGVSGLAIIANRFSGLPIGVLSLALNIPLILLSLRVIGIPFLLKSVYTMLINTLFLDVLLPLAPTYQGDRLLTALFTGVFMGAGLALIYMRGSSTGGSDFLVMSVKKKRPYLSIGRITLWIDGVIILLGGLAFRDVDAVLYGIVATGTCSLVIDNLLYGTGAAKLAIIITNHADAIATAISNETERGSTKLAATGTYTGEGREMLLCACSKREIYKVRAAAHAVDPACILVVTDASEVFGEGFNPPEKT